MFARELLDAFLHGISWTGAFWFFPFQVLIEIGPLPGDKSVPAFVLPNLLSGSPHLENRILVTRCAPLVRVFFSHTDRGANDTELADLGDAAPIL